MSHTVESKYINRPFQRADHTDNFFGSRSTSDQKEYFNSNFILDLYDVGGLDNFYTQYQEATPPICDIDEKQVRHWQKQGQLSNYLTAYEVAQECIVSDESISNITGLSRNEIESMESSTPTPLGTDPNIDAIMEGTSPAQLIEEKYEENQLQDQQQTDGSNTGTECLVGGGLLLAVITGGIVFKKIRSHRTKNQPNQIREGFHREKKDEPSSDNQERHMSHCMIVVTIEGETEYVVLSAKTSNQLRVDTRAFIKSYAHNPHAKVEVKNVEILMTHSEYREKYFPTPDEK